MRESSATSILVIGYGNTLRGDDALGCLIADELGRRGRPEVRTLSLSQLTPDLAAHLAMATAVLFIDACSCPSGSAEVQIEPLLPDGTGWATLDHAITPRLLLKLCQSLYGNCTQAWQISVPGSDFSLGEGLSRRAEAAMVQALEMIESLLARLCRPEPDGAVVCPSSGSIHPLPPSQDGMHEPAHHPG